MNSKMLYIAIFALLTAFVCWASPVVAQDDTTPLLNDEKINAIPVDEKLTDSQERIKLMRDASERVEGLLERSRDDELDFQKINCINEKFILIKGQLKVAEQAYVELSRAKEEADSGAEGHNYKLILIASDQIARLSGEASLCIGETTQLAGEDEETQLDIADGIADVTPVDATGATILDPSVDDMVAPQQIPELTPVQ